LVESGHTLHGKNRFAKSGQAASLAKLPFNVKNLAMPIAIQLFITKNWLDYIR
jgi:hypothetical protein